MEGINVIGHVLESTGLGNTARLFIRALQQRGVQVAALDVDGRGESAEHVLPGVRYCRSVDELPYRVNFIIVSILILPSVWRRRLPGLAAGRFVNVGLVFWELQIVPPAWVKSLALFDAIVVSSQFVRSAVELSLPEMPTIFAEHPLEPTVFAGIDAAEQQAMRARLGLQQEEVVFAASFDLRSDFARKNPLAVLLAFQKAFPTEPRARLLLKANGSGAQTGSRAARVLAQMRGDARIVYVDQTLDYREVMRLYSACDVFVSLHRAEGLGLGPMEAMLLGKPVLATGYSGNMTYMTEHNSIPVRYRLTRPEAAAWQFGPDFVGPAGYWAEPDIEAAAQGMKKLFADRGARETMGHVARRDILARQNAAWAAGFVEEIEALSLSPKPVTATSRLLRQVALQEYLDPVLRHKNFAAFWNAAKRRGS